MASLNLELVPFAVPSAVTIKLPSSGKREDGMQPSPSIPLSQLSEETLASLIEEFSLAVMTAAGKA